MIGSLPPALTAGSTAKVTVNYRKTGGDWEPVSHSLEGQNSGSCHQANAGKGRSG